MDGKARKVPRPDRVIPTSPCGLRTTTRGRDEIAIADD